MSASREKLKRKQHAEAGGGKDTKKARGDLNTVIFRNLVTVMCVLVVLALIIVILVGQGIPQQFLTAVNAEGQSITVAEFNFFYYGALADFYNEMGGFLMSYGMLDTSKPLHQQASFTEGISWHDYIVNDTLAKIRATVLWSETAKRESVQMTADDNDLIDDIIRTARDSADAQGVSLNRLLSTNYGRGVNESNYRKFLERQVLASRYETHIYESFTFSDQEITNHYNGNKNSFDKVDYREFRVSRYVSNEVYHRLVEEHGGEDVDLSELVDSPIGEIDFESKLAYDMVSALAENPDLTEENFNELAAALAWEEDRETFEDPDHTLVIGASFSDHDHDHGDDDHECDETLDDWLFDSARRHGDVTVMRDDDDFVALMFLERIVESDITVNMRQILITPVSDNDAGWSDAENRAIAVLNSFDNSDEQKFISLVRDNTMDQNTRHNGGLYEDMRRSFFDGQDDIADWLFDSVRKHGDVDVVKGSSGYHILYFSSWGRPFWQVNAENALRGEQNTELRTEKSANVPEPRTSWLGMLLTSRA